MDALSERKKLIVVINDRLMHNHQSELASAMAQNNYLLACTPNTLEDSIRRICTAPLIFYPDINYDAFPALIDELML